MEKLTDEEMDKIAKIAAQKALNYVYQEIGRSVLKKAAWFFGIVLLGLLTWLGASNYLRIK